MSPFNIILSASTINPDNLLEPPISANPINALSYSVGALNTIDLSPMLVERVKEPVSFIPVIVISLALISI